MSRSDRIVLAAGAGALVLAAAAAWLLVVPTPAPAGASLGSMPTLVGGGASPVAASQAPDTIVVDVQGAVAAPGIRELPAGSRVADAISAAGGYASDADLAAASASINLAQPLVDGAQVRVPRIGDGVTAETGSGSGGGAAGGGGGGGGLVDLNTATPEELEALPGIGPVTVQKIVAARQEQPFASLDDAVARGILNRGQLDQIQGLATAG